MATFIAISGPSSTGKTNLINTLSTHQELRNAAFSADMYNTVWSSLVEQGIFQSYEDIIRDSEYICIYLIKVIDYYKNYLEKYEESDKIVFLDCCWLDFLVYALLNMWCNRPIRELQEEILNKINELRDSVDLVYMTKFQSNLHTVEKFRSEFKIYSAKGNRSLELAYYDTFRNFNHVKTLETSEPSQASLFILNDLKDLGYLP